MTRLILLTLLAVAARAGSLSDELAALAQGFDGRVGACVATDAHLDCLRPAEHFSLQSVMKLLVGVAVLDHVDRGLARLDDPVTIRPADLSLYVQPLARLVGPAGFRTTLGDLVRRAIIDSDSAATDVLIARLGGPSRVQAMLDARHLTGLRLDRDERHLQTEIAGITWRPEFVDPAALDRALAAIPPAVRRAAWNRYRTDPRDTATPRGMAGFLLRLSRGELLSPASTAFILRAMAECRTFPDRLKAGLAPGWQIAHKTGTSGTWEGLTIATNDVGLLTTPDGARLAIAVFIADSRAPYPARAALMAQIARAAVRSAPPPSPRSSPTVPPRWPDPAHSRERPR